MVDLCPHSWSVPAYEPVTMVEKMDDEPLVLIPQLLLSTGGDGTYFVKSDESSIPTPGAEGLGLQCPML